MITVQTRVEIDRPIQEVFAYVADPRNFPEWNSAVQSVRRLGGGASHDHYLVRRNLGFSSVGPVANELEVIASERAREFAFRTTSGPTPFAYRIRFTRTGRGTALDVDASASLAPAASAAGPLARASVKRGVNKNLATLKVILERSVARDSELSQGAVGDL